MHRPALVLSVLAAAAVAFHPSRALAPFTETEPNDDPSAPGYAGALVLAGAAGLDDVGGDLSSGTDVDAYVLSTPAPGSAALVATGFTPPLSLQASHGFFGLIVASPRPYAFRGLFGFRVDDAAGPAPHLAVLAFSQEEGSNPYTLRVCRPGLDAAKASASAVFRDAAGGDSFKARLSYDRAVFLGPGASGDVLVFFRDRQESIPASSFEVNGAGTVFKYRAPDAAGVRSVTWNAKKGTIALAAAGLDLAADPVEGSLPVAVLGPLGGVGADLDGAVKAGAKSTKVSGKRK